MQDDFNYKRRNDILVDQQTMAKLVENDLLKALNNILKDHGYRNSNFNIGMPNADLERCVADTLTEKDPNAQRFYEENVKRLNNGQRAIYEKIVGLIDEDKGGCVSTDAPGGTGKTFLAEVILSYVRKSGNVAVACVMSGIVATLLSLGTTCHKRFGIPVPCTEESSSKHKLNSNESTLIKMAKIMIIDEVSMMEYKALDLIDRYLRVLMGNDIQFGGKLILLMHDFRQILPVVPGGNRAAVVSASVKSSENWDNFSTESLTDNMRVKETLLNKETHSKRQVNELSNYADWLLDVGDGKVVAAIEHTNIIEVPEKMVCKTKEELEDKVYDKFKENYNNEPYLADRVMMSSTNRTIQEQNFNMIQRIPTPEDPTIYLSFDICQDPDDQAIYDADTLNKIETSGLPPHRLILKESAVILLMKNLSVRLKHVNGGRYIITKLTNNLIFARKLNKEGEENSEILIPRIPTISKDTDGSFVAFKRTQFLVLVAYYLTLNRAQGQTLQKSGMFFPTSVFSHGHLYVGYSRCGNPNCCHVFAGHEEFENVEHLLDNSKTYTRNVVYKKIFQK